MKLFNIFHKIKAPKAIFNYDVFKKQFDGINIIPHFEEIAEAAFNDLPKEFEEELQKLDLIIEDIPSIDLIKRLRQIPYAVYIGIPINKKSTRWLQQEPDRVILFKKIIEKECAAKSYTEDETKDWIRQLVIHEVGHHFGFTDAYMGKKEQTA